MVSFQRMKDELDDLGTHVTNKLPVIGRGACIIISVLSLALVFAIGIAIGIASAPNGGGDRNSTGNRNIEIAYVFKTGNSTRSCPALTGGMLITTMEEGDSFEGLVVSLRCRGGYRSFPNHIQCRRKSPNSDELEWSHVPVCYPFLLFKKEYWTKTFHAGSVSCRGDASKTECFLDCVKDYVAVEKNPYVCTSSPCKPWSLGEAKCYICDKKCSDIHGLSKHPKPGYMLEHLGCSSNCEELLVTSEGNASIWQNRRTGRFTFIGEHNEHPVYQNNATKEFLFFPSEVSEWIIGPDFKRQHGGIQIILRGKKSLACPQFAQKAINVSKLYIDSSISKAGEWTEDDTLNVKCLKKEDIEAAVSCPCKKYKVYNLEYPNSSVPRAVEYFSGKFSKIEDERFTYNLLAPLYTDYEKNLYLFSHHPKGRVWIVSSGLSTTPIRGIFEGEGAACPDNPKIQWEWFNVTTPQKQQIFVKDRNIVVKCIKS